MSTVAVILKPDQVEKSWLIAKDYIKRCDGDISTADDLLPLLINGNRTLIMVKEDGITKGAAIACTVNGFERIARITTLGGDGADWDAAMDDFITQIKPLGYNRIEVQGRKGWIRALSDFDELYTVIGKAI